jgi:dihydrolipoamide dehydrogenase
MAASNGPSNAKNYDLVVIGSGPGGYSAAIRATQLGMKTAIVEQAELGGVCLNWGCIPTKALLRSAEIYSLMRHAADFGLSAGEPSYDFAKVIQRSRGVADRMNKGVAFLMKKNKIDVFPYRGRLGDQERTVVAGDETIGASKVMIATGARPRSLPGIAPDGERIITSREAMTLPERPERMLVIGAGAIGVEFAYFYATFGTKVTLVEMLPHLLPIEDEEISKELERSFTKRGITWRTATKVGTLARDGKVVRATLTGPKGDETVEADVALMAIGVQGNVEDLGLEKARVDHERGFIHVDAKMRTSNPDIVAIGDVVGPPLLAHVATSEGIVAVETLAGKDRPGLNYNKIPGCTYCQPQVASIGLSEKAAIERGYEVKVGRFPMRASGRAVAAGETDGLAKVVIDAKYGEVLGVHLIGPEVTEVIAEASMALAAEATAETIVATIHAHPTIAEVVLEATENALGHAINI